MSAAFAPVLWNHDRAARVSSYRDLVSEAIAALEIGLVPAPGEVLEGEIVFLGLTYRGDLRKVAPGMSRLCETAVAKLREASRRRPERPEAYLHLSRGLRVLGARQEADRALEQALKLDDEFLPALTLRLHDLREAGHDGEAEAMERRVDELARGRRGWTRPWVEAHAATVRGDWSRADDRLGALLRWSHVHGEPYVGFDIEMRLRRGRVLLKTESWDRAEYEFTVVRERWPDWLGPSLLLAETYRRSGADEMARWTLDDTLERYGTGVAPIVASVYVGLADTDRALEVADSIPDPAKRAAARAHVFFRANQHESAVAAARQAIRLGVEDKELYVILGWTLTDLRRPREARKALEEGLRKHPDDPELTPGMGWATYYTGDLEDARRVFERRPDHHRSLLGLGWVYYRMKLQHEAIAAHRRALDLYPRNHFAYGGIGSSYDVLGELGPAVDNYVQCVLLNPRHNSLLNLRIIYSAGHRDLFGPHWDKLRRALTQLRQSGGRHFGTLGFLALSELYASEPDPTELSGTPARRSS